MNRTELHPDHLLARHRTGALTADERATLDRHVARCVTCAFEMTAAEDFQRDLAAPVPERDLATITARVHAALAAEGAAPRRRVRRAPVVALVAAAAVFGLAATAVAAGVVTGRITLPTLVTGLAPALAPAPRVAVRLRSRTDHVARVAVAPVAPAAPASELPLLVAEPSGSPPLFDQPERSERRHHHHRHHDQAVAAAPTEVIVNHEESARELFEQARRARGERQYDAAAALFERLQQRYGDTDEASVSQIALGRLWLDRLGQPARALARFEGYLAAHPHGESREEAMVGRAVALERLERTAAAREAWEAVRDAFPGSVSAERARVRIDALR